ncbi:Homocysteine S-methyltransferase 1 [Cyphellophora attinorum]|uniref:Homocysteine S-methyltransferase 1 n=1 Tax=Cyphellophora attinorum TaxID=1664694 RepID=A0A0N1HIE1_9EURO|nr:Homocysteine S-methyltransferase 1 [Phialophora attinorum]KPI46095.1 Homocysteine S-methyltransferase 1 [Phialophora attinorum]
MPPILLDGGFSRELIRLGAPFAQPEWSALSLLSPESHTFVSQAHTAFARAGADILTTNSYAIVPFHIGEERFWERGKELASDAGRLARSVASEEEGRRGTERETGEDGSSAASSGLVRVAGSLPPIFGSYEPALFDASRVQEHLAVLVGGLAAWVDLWLGETLSLIAEAEAVRTAVKRSGKPIWIAFTLDDRSEQPDSEAQAKLRGGETVAEAAAKLIEWDDVDAILFNCSKAECMLPAVKQTKAVFDAHGCKKLIGVYANRFEPQGEDYKANAVVSTLRDDLGTDRYVEFAKNWIEAGAGIVGGCCGVGSEHIRRLGEELVTKEHQTKGK